MSDATARDLWDAFTNPPADARPRTWWHWMNGNINNAGIVKDLQWMHEIGIGGVQVFEGGLGAPLAIPERVVYRTPEWFDALRTAAEKAKELGIEFTMATSAGWSALGGPWVEAKDAMRKLVWSDTCIDASASLHRLAALPSNTGAYQDAPEWPHGSPIAFVEDVACVAFPDAPEFHRLTPDSIEVSSEFEGNVASLTDGSFASGIAIPRDPHSNATAHVTFVFDEAVTLGSATVGIGGPKGFGAPFLPEASISVSDDGVTFVSVCAFHAEVYTGQAGECPARTAAFPAVTARFIRLELASRPLAAAQPPLLPGTRGIPFTPPGIDRFHVTEFALYPGGRVHAAEHKAGFSIARDYFGAELLSAAADTGIAPESVIDVSEFVDGDGVLRWQPPAGAWRVLRFGTSLTGHVNGPAPAEATGLEVDKLDGARVRRYLEQYLAGLAPALGDAEEALLSSFLSDSIESGAQNWTDNVPAAFEQRNGYELTAWFPALAGWVVRDRVATDRVLYDFRQTLNALFHEGMYGTIAAFAHEHGLEYYAEALEDKRPQLGDDLVMRSHADIPMGAMWCFDPEEGPHHTYIADLLGAASVAHVYGKSHTGCESMTAFGKPFVFAPWNLKHVADLELSLGVTRFNIHTSPHQPEGVAAPGITMAPVLGQSFSRNETWAKSARPWIEYLTRASALLNLLSPSAQTLYCIGEERPVTGLWGESDVDIPSGYAIDFVSTDALLNAVTVDADARLHSAQGEYRHLHLAGSWQQATLALLRRLRDFADAGVTMTGFSPPVPAGLADDTAEFHELVQRLWGGDDPTIAAVGSFADALAAAGINSQDWQFRTRSGDAVDAGYGKHARIRCAHRSGADADIYFVANALEQSLEVFASFRAIGDRVFWFDPVDPARSHLIESVSGSRTELEVTLGPWQSGFVVIERGEAALSLPQVASVRVEPLPLDGPWTLRIGDRVMPAAELRWDLRDEEALRHFSGTAVLSAKVEIESMDRLDLDLRDFRDIVDVYCNGVHVGTVWARGQHVSLAGAARPGENLLELHVTNTWWNRVLGDTIGAARLDGEAGTYVAWSPFVESGAVRPSGLAQPPVLR